MVVTITTHHKVVVDIVVSGVRSRRSILSGYSRLDLIQRRTLYGLKEAQSVARHDFAQILVASICGRMLLEAYESNHRRAGDEPVRSEVNGVE